MDQKGAVYLSYRFFSNYCAKERPVNIRQRMKGEGMSVDWWSAGGPPQADRKYLKIQSVPPAAQQLSTDTNQRGACQVFDDDAMNNYYGTLMVINQRRVCEVSSFSSFR